MTKTVVGIGIDDMFVITQCWSNMMSDIANTNLPLPDKMGVALKHAGVSITITTATDVLAFGIGAFSVSILFYFILSTLYINFLLQRISGIF